MLDTGMNVLKLGTICALFAATPNLIGCESSRDSPDRQFQKQIKRAQECRQLQDKLVGDQSASGWSRVGPRCALHGGDERL
jgi:hypothetical protein